MPWTLLRGRIGRTTEDAESTYVLCFVTTLRKPRSTQFHAHAQSCGATASQLNNDMVASQRQDCRLVIIKDLPQDGFGMLTEQRRCNGLNHRRASEFQR